MLAMVRDTVTIEAQEDQLEFMFWSVKVRSEVEEADAARANLKARPRVSIRA